MGFARGEPVVEIAAEDPNRRTLQFYLLKFELACEATKTCVPGDQLTPAIEKNWKSWTLYQDEDLKNTIVDCRHCHQPGGPSTKPMLRMQELQGPVDALVPQRSPRRRRAHPGLREGARRQGGLLRHPGGDHPELRRPRDGGLRRRTGLPEPAQLVRLEAHRVRGLAVVHAAARDELPDRQELDVAEPLRGLRGGSVHSRAVPRREGHRPRQARLREPASTGCSRTASCPPRTCPTSAASSSMRRSRTSRCAPRPA